MSRVLALLAASALVVISPFTFQPALAGASPAPVQDVGGRDSAQRRSDLLSFIEANQTVAYELGMDRQVEAFKAATRQIQQLSAAELNVLLGTLADTSGMNAATQQLRSQIRTQRIPQIEGLAPRSGITKGIGLKDAGFPNASYPSCGSTRVSDTVIDASDVSLFVAEGVKEAASRACEETVVVLGEGGNGSLVCLISDGIYLAAKVINFGLHYCNDKIDQAELGALYDRVGHIHDNLASSIASDTANKNVIVTNDNTNMASIVANDNANRVTIVGNDNTNTANILANDNANKTAIVVNANANALALTNLVSAALSQIIVNANANKDDVKNLLIRTQIEADLSSDDGRVVALYQTPSTRCFPSLNILGLPQTGLPANIIQCGLLDLVRSIVSQTIVNGGNDKDALKDFATGDAQRTAGQYKAAYASYRKAYKSAWK